MKAFTIPVWKLLCTGVLVAGLLMWALIISAGIWVVQRYVTWGVVYMALAIAAFGIGVFLFSEQMAVSALRAESRKRGER